MDIALYLRDRPNTKALRYDTCFTIITHMGGATIEAGDIIPHLAKVGRQVKSKYSHIVT